MSIKKLTTTSTEADLEGRIHAVLQSVFPWLKPDDLQHQTTFQFQFGRSVVEVNGKTVSKAQARTDILISHNEIPLAILELKRPGNKLTSDDEAQGLSYARMLDPRPPIVVISNGEETLILASHTGKEWVPETPSETELVKLIEAAGQIAAADMKHAVEVLLGPGSTVWVEAVRAATEAILTEQMGGWGDIGLPFISDFLIPRQATNCVLNELLTSKRLVIVEGAPLVGKSNVLRDVIKRTTESDDFAVLFVEADGAGGSGIIQNLAYILSDALGWPVSVEETRTWLHHLSNSESSTLVLAVDGIGPTRDEIRRDIEELTGNTFGPKLRIVLAIDDTVTERLVMNETGRKITRIGRRSTRVSVKTLNELEFKSMLKILYGIRIGIMTGGHKAPELRHPWVLRALVANVVSSPQYAKKSTLAVLPPLLGLDLIEHSRTCFKGQEDTRRQFQAMADAVIADNVNQQRSTSFVLESMVTFLVLRKTLLKFIDSNELTGLIDRGLVKTGLNESNEAIIIPRLPELLASEIALRLAHGLAKKLLTNPKKAADWLVSQTSSLPLGDVIGAQTLLDTGLELGSLPLELIRQLLIKQPLLQKIQPGMRMAMHTPETGMIDLTFRADGKISARRGGTHGIIEMDEGDELVSTYSNMESWLILSYVAGHKILVQSSDDKIVGQVEPAILIEVGTCPFTLLRPINDFELGTLLTHDMGVHGSIVCHENGIVEPITMSILRFIKREKVSAIDWIEEAVERNSLPLLARIDIALRQLTDSTNKSEASWARETLENIIQPAFKMFPHLH